MVLLKLVFYTSMLILLCTFSHSLPGSELDKGKQEFYNANFEESLKLLSEITSQKSLAEAEYYIGLVYSSPEFQLYDLDKSIKYLEQSASKGYIQAARALSQLYYRSSGELDTSMMTSIYWSKEADRLTYSSSKLTDEQYHLSEAENKKITQEDMLQRQIQLSEAGSVNMQFQLAKRYEYGVGIGIDLNQANYWYEKAALGGNETASMYLGYSFCKGIGVKKDPVKAKYWFKKSGSGATCNTKF